jgi:Na+/proline symporter
MSHLDFIDFLVIITFFLIIFGIAAYYTRRAGKSTGNFFLSGRNMPWYIAGTAMVATTFAADTPLAVTELVARNGIAGNWLWWNMAIGAMLTVFFFARLWRRAGIVTDVEFVELRYSGIEASALRGFRALYLGIFMNAIVMGWVNKAMEKIFKITIPEIDPFLLVVAAALIIAVYASASGLLGTARTDSFQFVFAMSGCIILAIVVVQLPQVGGMVSLREQLAPQIMDFFPQIGDVTLGGVTGGALALSLGAFIAHIGLQWWSTWYPGADPGGGGYIAQRMMSAKDEKHSLLATLWFTIAHYTIRPWPWIIVALAALVILPRAQNTDEIQLAYPDVYEDVVNVYNGKTSSDVLSTEQHRQAYEMYENTVDPGIMYPKLMVQYLPSGLLGLLIAVFLAAYMSTIASQLNWGTSYIINDFYRRFITKSADERHYVRVSRLAIILMTVFSLLLTKYVLTTISGAWEFIINASAGMGAVLILRWYWWRVNAWTEIAAMIAPLIIYPIARYGFGLGSPLTLYPTVIGTTIIWMTVMYVTPPVKESTLHHFYQRVRPGGIGWKKFAAVFPDVQVDQGLQRMFFDWILGVIVIYAFLFGIGQLIFGLYTIGIILITIGSLAAFLIYLDLSRREI